MTSSPAAAGQIRESDPSEPPFSPTPVEELLRLVAKAARAHQLYLPNNPIYRGAIDSLRGGFASVWAETDDLSLAITEGEFRWFDVVVSRETGAPKSTDNLPWLFYKDGVRELTMLPGFEETEVITFLEMIQRARKANEDEDDLVTMLWEADFAFLKYRYVDVLQEGTGANLTDGAEVTAASASDVRDATREAVEQPRAGTIVDMSDFDATLYFLDDGEIEYLQSEIVREYQQDLRVKVAWSLLDIFEVQADSSLREEVLRHLQTLMVYLLTAGHYRGVARVLREAALAAERASGVTPAQRALLSELADRLSSPEILSQLLQSVDASSEPPSREELGDLFDQLRPAALATACQWLGLIQNETARSVLSAAASRLAAANTGELVRLIQHADGDISIQAIRLAGEVKAQAAVTALGRAMSDPDAGRRLAIVQALTEITSPGALQALEKALDDADRDVRIVAARALTARAHRPALARFDAIIKGKAVREADRTEKMVFFEGFGSFCGDAGVPHLDGVLNGKSFLGRREDPEIRACAAMALGRVGSPAAIEALRKSAGEKDVIVRNAVARALRGGSASGGGE